MDKLPVFLLLDIHDVTHCRCPSEKLGLSLWRQLGLSNFSINEANNYAFYLLVAHGHLDACKWLTWKFDLWQQVKAKHDDFFITAASNYRLHVCKWLVQEFGLPSVERLEIVYWYTFSLDLIKWLVQDLGLYSKWILYFAVREGHLDTCKWLSKHLNWTISDIAMDDHVAFRWACKYGHLNICRWMAKKFKLTAQDVRSQNNYAFRHAAANGYLRVCQWLVANFGLTIDDVTDAENFAWTMLAWNRNEEIQNWLVTRFGSGVSLSCQQHCENDQENSTDERHRWREMCVTFCGNITFY